MKYLNTVRTVTAVVTFAFLAALPANAGNIKVIPLGSHDGEFCSEDRALIFEDPDGTRILYDPGRTVIGKNDPRLGKINVVLVSHMHRDHVGNWHYPKVNFGKCGDKVDYKNTGKPNTVKYEDMEEALPNTNAVNIALEKDAKIVTGSEMYKFFEAKLEAGGKGKGEGKNSWVVGFGASRKVGGVTITTVPANHPNDVHKDLYKEMIDGDLVKLLTKTELDPLGPATGYVLVFSNGLAVYLSGDTNITEEQDTVVRQHYEAKLVVMNINNPRGPKCAEPRAPECFEPFEAARIISTIKPVSVIVSHAREAATTNGKVTPGTKTDRFINIIKITDARVKVYVPLSVQKNVKSMEFDGAGNCVAGC